MRTQGFHADVQVASFRSQHCAAGWLGCGARLRQKACARDALGALRRREHVLEMCLCSKQSCARYVLGFRPDGRACARKGIVQMCSGHVSGRNTEHWLHPKQRHTQYIGYAAAAPPEAVAPPDATPPPLGSKPPTVTRQPGSGGEAAKPHL